MYYLYNMLFLGFISRDYMYICRVIAVKFSWHSIIIIFSFIIVLQMCSYLTVLVKWYKRGREYQHQIAKKIVKKYLKNSKNDAKMAKNSLKGPEVFGQVGSNVASNINTKLHN